MQKPDEKTSDRKNLCSGVILAGGLSTRLGGRNKAFLEIGGMRILDRIYGVFTELFDEIILVTNHPLLYLNWDVVITTDIFPIRSSLTGIHAGLFAVSNPYAFVAACDTPFLKKEVVQTILDGIETRFDVVIPETRAGLEPLCAAYSKRCLTPMTHSLKQEKFMIRRLFARMRVRMISEKKILEKDPELTSFLNINTPEDLAACGNQKR